MSAYAIVKTGGKQYKVAVGDVVEVEKLEGEPGTEHTFPAVLYAWHATRGATRSGSHWKRTVSAPGAPAMRAPPPAVKR